MENDGKAVVKNGMRTFEIKKKEIPEIQTPVCFFFIYDAMKPQKRERGPRKHTVNPKKGQ